MASKPPPKLIARSSSTDSDDSAAAYDAGTDPYSSDHFRMFEFKVRRCTRSRSHDWTDCPFAHSGEKARRRDPRKFRYSGALCPDFRRSGTCSRSDHCTFAHGVFEAWLHPSRYRTEACKDGRNCNRKVCFFAHSPRELRVLPSDDVTVTISPGNETSHCCKHCTCSPRSTLMSPAGRFAWANGLARAPHDELAYEDMLDELAQHLEVMNFKEANFPGSVAGAGAGGIGSYCFESSPVRWSYGSYKGLDLGSGDPDLGWVNDLLT